MQIEDWLCEVFPNYTKAMAEGNEPCGKGHDMLDGGVADRWSCRWGSGETYKGELLFAEFSINHKICIYIVGDTVTICDNRYAGKTDEWIYCNHPQKMIYGCHPSKIHELESEKIEQILNSKIDCKFWKIVRDRVRQLYLEAQVNGIT